MRSRGPIRCAALAALALATACSTLDAIDRGPGYFNGYGNVTVDGTDTSGRTLPPVGYECYPHYRVKGGYVYDVHGYYYKNQDGSWSILRSAPSEVRYEDPILSGQRRCIEYPP
jgi:hypothetical protein